MKLTAYKFLGSCAAVLAAATGLGAPLEVGLEINGNVRVGGKAAQLALTIHHERWSGQSTGIRTDFAFPDKATGTANFELFADKERSGHGSATLLPTADGRAVYVVTATSELDQNPEATVLSLTLPFSVTNGTMTGTAGGRCFITSSSVSGNTLKFYLVRPAPIYTTTDILVRAVIMGNWK